jgi:hypothetical protein
MYQAYCRFRSCGGRVTGTEARFVDGSSFKGGLHRCRAHTRCFMESPSSSGFLYIRQQPQSGGRGESGRFGPSIAALAAIDSSMLPTRSPEDQAYLSRNIGFPRCAGQPAEVYKSQSPAIHLRVFRDALLSPVHRECPRRAKVNPVSSVYAEPTRVVGLPLIGFTPWFRDFIR